MRMRNWLEICGMNSKEERQRAVAWGLAMTSGTPIAPTEYELALLAAFVEGDLTLDEVLVRLEEPELVVLAGEEGRLGR